MTDSSYLHNLKFDEKLKNSFIAKYILNPRLVILLALTIVGVGIYTFLALPKTLNPDIKIPIVIVSTVLPGAGPSDVESLLTIPIEDAVNGVNGIDTVTSSSVDSASTVEIQFHSGIDPEKARTDVQSAVDTIANTLPKDAKTPNVTKVDFTHSPVWTFSLTTKNDQGSLTRYAKLLKQKIKDLPSVDDVTLSGLQEQEVQIILKPEAMNTYGVNPQQLSQVISTELKSFPAGSVSTDKSSFALTIDQAISSIEDIRNLQININGNIVPLSTVAQVYENTKPDQNPSYIASNKYAAKPAITFNVYKTSSVDIAKAYSDTKALIDQEKVIQDGQFTIYSVTNAAEQINTQFSDLERDFSITIALVFIVLFVFLGIRQAIIASLAIPLTFAISFAVMNATGLQLSFISLFSLLLSLGLLVDDTIVVASAMTAYHRAGKFTPAQTGLLVWRDFIIAIFTTTITTVWAFFPLLLSSGIIGEFIKPIPIVVSTTLIASFLVAMLITLPFIIMLLEPRIPRRVVLLLRTLLIILIAIVALNILPKGKLFSIELILLIAITFVGFIARDLLWHKIKTAKIRSKIKKYVAQYSYINKESMQNGLIHFTIISSRYHSLIENILKSPSKRKTAMIMAIIFCLFSYLLLPFGLVKNEFFPKTDQDYVYMALQLPAGTNAQTAKNEALKITNQLRKIAHTDYVSSEVGQSLSQMDGGVSGSGSNNILFTIVLPPKNERKMTSLELGQMLRDRYSNLSDGKISVTESTGGPPAGSDLQIKLFGDNLTTLNQYADKIQNHLKAMQGVVNIDKSVQPGTSKLVFVPDSQKVATVGLTQDQLGYWLRLFASGMTADSIKFADQGNDKTDITIRTSPMTQSPLSLEGISIPINQNGTTSNINLASLGTIQLENNPTIITREGGKRTISVSASVTKGYSVTELNKQLETYANALNLPTGYSWATGGVNEENTKSVQSIMAAMLLSFLLIIITMVVQFSSFRRALIVMLVIPLSISGVFIMFALTNTPLSFPALIGVLALFGIVVKNSILLVDKIVQNHKAGLAFIPSIADAASSRLEAIALTSVATIMGLIPITLSDPTWRGLGGAIIAGLTFSGTIMLFFIPVVYYYWFQSDPKLNKK